MRPGGICSSSWPAALSELRSWLDELERFWQQRLGALGDYLNQAPA